MSFAQRHRANGCSGDPGAVVAKIVLTARDNDDRE